MRTLPNNIHPKISLLGSRIGANLATTLALTLPNSIHSVAISEPIPDWVSLDSGSETNYDHDPTNPTTSTTKKVRPNHYTSTDARPLLTLRSTLFRKPDQYFDPFASPTLFLRAPGRDCPQPYLDDRYTSSGGDESFGPYDDDSDNPSWPHSSSFPSILQSQFSDPELDDIALSRPIKRRKVLRRWPPNAAPESVRLPHFRVFVTDEMKGEGLVLRQQGEELVDLMRRVCFYGVERRVGEGRVGLEALSGVEKEIGVTFGLKEGAEWLVRKCKEEEEEEGR